MQRNYHDPLGLATRILRSGSREARAALFYAAASIGAQPIDLLLAGQERKRIRRAGPGRHPLVFVVGPPRSGTTVAYQSLVKALPVSYFNNLTSVFPRSPITISRIARRPFRNREVDLASYYGRTAGWWKPNDGLYLWDRWLGADRRAIPERLDLGQSRFMVQFFGAWTEEFDLPLVNKNNALNHSAHLVADLIPQSHFICLTRNPVFLAQSLLRARTDIHGTEDVPYGVEDPGREHDEDPIRDVCMQVRFHSRAAHRQEDAIGSSRFWIVSYEEFCARPALLAARVGNEILGLKLRVEELDPILPPLPISSRKALPDVQFDRLVAETIKLENA